ncbi:MAG: fumarylacetoacetate hydrolase family protein, partial [Phycisphaerales bacterium]|nr:fumarylacetoacetate hydrolase family protein [Phycisphaerales bacterium]
SGGQFNRGKSFDTFCPLGPSVVGVSEIDDPHSLRIVCRVNGEVMQDANTSQMMFPIPRLIAMLSSGTTLAAGTVILTGTPSGVGMARDPQVWLSDGDVVEVEIESVGVLKNRVRFG